jgi:hypothetical protein
MLIYVSAYIHKNPVAAGLVKKPEHWEFSSYQDFAGLRNGKLPQKEIILSAFQKKADYQTFVMDYIDYSNIQKYIVE